MKCIILNLKDKKITQKKLQLATANRSNELTGRQRIEHLVITRVTILVHDLNGNELLAPLEDVESKRTRVGDVQFAN